MSEAALKEHLESLYDAFLTTGDEAKAKEFAAYVRYCHKIVFLMSGFS